ncbi:origin of replication complex subunit 1 [Iris pallida]|uniref:Origin of replication complex subunit 1 n=1 Tax=Iris pallida TaxID=29817 RepID=A0AAX6DRY4_IRIPA|nr:origin of replication complex subunit 1 [Iris pallida]
MIRSNPTSISDPIRDNQNLAASSIINPSYKSLLHRFNNSSNKKTLLGCGVLINQLIKKYNLMQCL